MSMSQIDLYSLLKGYAGKIKSSNVRITDFLKFAESLALQKVSTDPQWSLWSVNASAQFYAEIPNLVEKGRCILLADGADGRIFLPSVCRESILNAYDDIDKLADQPFPNAVSIKLNMPAGYARTVHLAHDLRLFFEELPESPQADDVIALEFPQGCGSGLLLASMIPRRLMEMSLLKIRHYLHSHSNKDYVLNKLMSQMKGKEKAFKDTIDQIKINPIDSLNEMERSADFPYFFWTLFCSMIKNEIGKQDELQLEDLAVMQAVCVIEVCSSFYHTKAAKSRDIDAAFLTLEVLMDRPPWRYTLDEIAGFTNDRDIPLLEIYSNSDLEEYIQKVANDGDAEALSSWLVIPGARKIDRWFVKKERYLQVCTKMIAEVRPQIKAAMLKRWFSLVADFSSEPAMKADDEFDRLLVRLTKDINPTLQAMLEDRKLYLTYVEMEKVPGAISPSSRIFRNGRLLPHRILFALHRKELLIDVRLKFPIWYSIPFMVGIFLFFRNLGFKKKQRIVTGGESDSAAVEHESNEMRQSVRLIESAIIPKEKDIDIYLSELEGKWAHLLDKKARQNLIGDVQSLLRDSLRSAIKIYKLKRITRDNLQEMADSLIQSNPALKSLTNQKSLLLYMEVYLVKLLLNYR